MDKVQTNLQALLHINEYLETTAYDEDNSLIWAASNFVHRYHDDDLVDLIDEVKMNSY